MHPKVKMYRCIVTISRTFHENEDKRHPIYYWDESKKEFIRDGKYFSNAFGGRSGPELEGPVIAKCEAVGINIR